MSQRIKVEPIDVIKLVNKPWGSEKWIQQGIGNHSYVLKEIVLKAGHRTSIQVHQFKAETNYILEGTGRIVYGKDAFDCDQYLRGQYSAQELQKILDSLIVESFGPGSVMQIEPGTIHRMQAVTDLRFVEASTTHLDDVIRLQDDANRSHGLIESEHRS